MSEYETSLPSDEPKSPPAQTWSDLLLYFVVGFGLFLTASFILRSLTKNVSIVTSALLYLANVLVFSGTVYLVGVRRGKLSWAGIGFWPPRWSWLYAVLAVGVAVVFIPIRTLLALAVELILKGNLNDLVNSARMQIFAPSGFSWLNFAVTLALAGLAAPVAEELFFRGAIYTWFRSRYSVAVAVLASSIIFALGHFDTLAVVVTSFVIGVINALVYERTRSIWAPIAIHAFNNSLAVVLVYLTLALKPG